VGSDRCVSTDDCRAVARQLEDSRVARCDPHRENKT
jgi:hypothetical protein